MMRIIIILLLTAFMIKVSKAQTYVEGFMISEIGDTAYGFIRQVPELEKEGGFAFYDSAGKLVNSKSSTWKGFSVFIKNGRHDYINIIDKRIGNKEKIIVERVLVGKISVFKRFLDLPNSLNPFNPIDNNAFTKDYIYYLQKEIDEYIPFDFSFLSNRKKILKKLFDDCEMLRKEVKGAMNEEVTFYLILKYNKFCK